MPWEIMEINRFLRDFSETRNSINSQIERIDANDAFPSGNNLAPNYI